MGVTACDELCDEIELPRPTSMQSAGFITYYTVAKHRFGAFISIDASHLSANTKESWWARNKYLPCFHKEETRCELFARYKLGQ
jgi:hypothetical protein